ncbi:MAG TPA: hypothetical protein VHV82_16760 [Sporichthyaceae bacterium]|jgi:hypothetical protein|nr:hypothetical protein [Sporichthyaceae bacterium]
MSSHEGGGFAPAVAVLVVVLVHLAAGIRIVASNPKRSLEVLRGFLADVREGEPSDPVLVRFVGPQGI